MKSEAFEIKYHPEFDKEVERFITRRRTILPSRWKRNATKQGKNPANITLDEAMGKYI